MKLSGVFVATITPFDAGGGIAFDQLESHLEFLVQAGVHGFVPCGTTGESATLTADEWREVIRVTRKVAIGYGLKTVAGCGGNCTAVALERIREARELGCDAALVVTPYYNKPTDRGLLAHFEHLAEQGDFPLILYNVPSRTNVNLSVPLVSRLFNQKNIVGIKEASGHYAQWLELASTVELKDKALLAGDDDAFALMLQLGGSGIISASANLVPRLFVELYRFAERGEWAEAFQLQKRLFPLTKALFAETNPSPVKAGLAALGKISPDLRLPLVSATAETEKMIRAAMAGLELLTIA